MASTVKDKKTAAAVEKELKLRYWATTSARGNSWPTSVHVTARPGCTGNVTLDIYEIKEPKHFEAVESLAREAQAAVPEAGNLHLRFFERQVLVSVEGGGGYRAAEKLLKAVTLASQKPSRGAER